MQYYYGALMPLRILDEVEFWKQQEEEHTVVIRSLVKGLEDRFVAQLKEWEQVLSQTHQTAVRYIESLSRAGYQVNDSFFQEIMGFVSYCLKQSDQFIHLCQTLKEESQAISGNLTAKIVMDHIIRESEYFVGIAQTLLNAEEQ